MVFAGLIGISWYALSDHDLWPALVYCITLCIIGADKLKPRSWIKTDQLSAAFPNLMCPPGLCRYCHSYTFTMAAGMLCIKTIPDLTVLLVL